MEEPSAGVVPARRSYTAYDVFFALGLLAGACILAAGLYEMAIHPEHRFPGFDPLTEANTLLAQGDARGAARRYFVAEAILRQDPAVPRRLADALAQLGDLPGEIEARRRVVALTPRSTASLLALGASLLKAGRNQDAAFAFTEALQLDPRSEGAHVGLGDARAKDGRRTEAIAAYGHALEIAPGDAAAHNGLAIALAGEGRLLEARAEFKAAAGLSPDPAILSNLREVEAELARGGR